MPPIVRYCDALSLSCPAFSVFTTAARRTSMRSSSSAALAYNGRLGALLDSAGAPELTWSSLLRASAVDWAAVALLLVLGLSTEGVAPTRQFLQTEVLWHYSYPLLPNTVPSWSVLPIAFLLPSAVLGALHATQRLERRALCRLLLGLWAACSATFAVTNALKVAVGRPRPNFAARCWPNGTVAGVPGTPLCEGTPHSVAEGLKSFPSGHTSLTTAGLAYLALALLARVRPGEPGNTWRTMAALSPLALALYVGVTRVSDYWHHWTDVAAGAALGLSFATLMFHKLGAAKAEEAAPLGPEGSADAPEGGQTVTSAV